MEDLEDDLRARIIAAEVEGCDPDFVATLRIWGILDAHIATIRGEGFSSAADFGKLLPAIAV
jgi:hypothetical protein